MLQYRFPGKEIVIKKGSFKSLLMDDYEGFIISDFNQKKTYFFDSESTEDIPQYEQVKPFVASKNEYLQQSKEIIRLLASDHTLKKIVYSRIKEVALTISGNMLFERLSKAYPSAFVYHFQDPKLGEWIGASPEILVRGKYGVFESMALAGTKKASDTMDWGNKEKEEQAFVSQYLAERLQQQNVLNMHADGPKTVLAGPIAHLRTDFKWDSDSKTAWEIAKDLHPTPAVSGTPVSEATEWILSNEKHERSFYAGMIGEITSMEINTYVNLRCAQIINDRIYLYLGGGFTADSIPEKEWEETENKSKTLLDLL
jgi:isochorismate synthase